MGFRLIPTSMTLNDLERPDSPYLAFFSPNSIALLTNYVRVVEDRHNVHCSHNIVSQFHCSTFGQNYPTLQRGLSVLKYLVHLLPCSVV